MLEVTWLLLARSPCARGGAVLKVVRALRAGLETGGASKDTNVSLSLVRAQTPCKESGTWTRVFDSRAAVAGLRERGSSSVSPPEAAA